ncbi:MAG: type V CRISPR-associated protein Cas12a/Cpf1, partial [Sulfurovum sp.]|nr:type V CRISPR-associated protein Cas12a/Cpf1 [Sulfurovum sp.]
MPKDDNDNGGEGYQQTQTIKKTLDAYQNLLRHFRLFSPLVNKTREVLPDANMAFYNAFEEPFVEFDRETTALYNKVRNYLSKKPFSREKFKLNFDSPTLLDGWDINQERANRSVLLIKDGKYYLAIMRPKHTDVFSNAPKDNNGDFYKKINYKLVPEANKMFPKVFFSEKGIERYSPPKDVLDAYKNGEHKKGKTFNIDSMRKIIDYFKSVVPKYKVDDDDEFGWDVFGFSFSPTESYEDISQFYKEVKYQGYKIWMSEISSDYIKQVSKEGKIFLFQIYNKDFSPYAKGRPNMHTLYWKSLFEPQNLQNVVTKLNGKAEIFFRYKSIKKSEAV